MASRVPLGTACCERSPYNNVCILVRWPMNTQHPYSLCLQHQRRPKSDPPDLIPRLCKHFIGIGRNHGILVLAAGGISNDSHLLIALPANVPVAKAPSFQSQLLMLAA